jgi:ATP-dependent Zn protease
MDLEEVFLGRNWMSQRSYSEEKSAEIDREVSRMLRDLYADALRRLASTARCWSAAPRRHSSARRSTAGT